RATPQLDADGFVTHLRTIVVPVIDAMAAAVPHQVEAVADVLYELSLDLVGKELLGPKARYPVLPERWRLLFTRLPAHLSAAPRLFAGSVTNALYNLAVTPGARPREWIDSLLMLGPICPDPAALLAAGQAAAWRCGLAHLRGGALATCTRLAPAAARIA